MARPDAPDDAPPEDPESQQEVLDAESSSASPRTRELIHELAVGITRLGTRLQELQDTTKRHLDEVRHDERVHRVEDLARSGSEKARSTAQEAAGRAAEAIAQARAIALGFVAKAEETTEQTTRRLQESTQELGARARSYAAAGKDFYADHREEIIALLITAAKVAAVIGVRRLTAPREHEEGLESKKGRRSAAKRLIDTTAILTAIIGQVGTLLAKQPSALPMLRELYARGEPAEQAVVGMLLGPALSSDPDHAVEVLREFLENATSEGAADAIARRSLAPLLEENPDLVPRVTAWFQAAAPFVRRGALLALSRFVSDKRSITGDVLAAAVVVLEDHDEEVRLALGRLIGAASRVDPDATAAALARGLRAPDQETRVRTERLVDTLPEDMQRRVDAARTDREA